VCAEWADLAPAFEALMQDQPAIALAAAADAVMHGSTSTRPWAGPGTVRRSMCGRRRAATPGWPPSGLRRPGRARSPSAPRSDDLTGGGGGAVLSLTAPAFDILLSLTGRRSGAAILALPWSGDPGPVVELLSPYGPLPAETLA
jgi:hypothetical protein